MSSFINVTLYLVFQFSVRNFSDGIVIVQKIRHDFWHEFSQRKNFGNKNGCVSFQLNIPLSHGFQTQKMARCIAFVGKGPFQNI